jgi:NDP-sugar pyrophosphorylase family protein
MIKLTLVIMAAGLGSRFGSTKQLESFGPNGERIMDYAMFDAINLGFGKIVIIVRAEIEDEVKQLYSKLLKGKIEFETVIQKTEIILPGTHKTFNRQKPWGTGHALLSATQSVSGPFVLINADDFYGKDALEKVSQFLLNQGDPISYALAGYRLANTLSPNGRVSRAVCETDNTNHLVSIVENLALGFNSVGNLTSKLGQIEKVISPDVLVSMNCWGFQPSVFQLFKNEFQSFCRNESNLDKEFFLPTIIQQLTCESRVSVTVLPIENKCFGVTFQQDKELVISQLITLVSTNIYPENLWN